MTGALRACVLLAVLAGCARDSDPASTAAPGAPEKQTVEVPAEPPAQAEPQVVFETSTGEVRATVEVVSTPARIQRGLMHRRHLSPDRGMLFVFASERVRSFWMKNTLIPLDMLFVKSDMRVAGIERDTVPLSLKSRSIGIKTRYVIEVNAGWTAKHGIDAGTVVRFENMPRITSAPL